VSDWKQQHADAADAVFDAAMVRDVMEEFAANMGFQLDGLPGYGLHKVVSYAAQVARAQALGFDPELLRLSDDEADAATLAVARAMVAAGKPVLRLDESGITRLD